MLVVTTTVGMVHGVHSHTTSAGPAAQRESTSAPDQNAAAAAATANALVTLGLELVERAPGLEQRLVDTPAPGDDPDRRARAARDGLLRAGRQPDARLVLLGRVADDRRVVAGRARERAAVAGLLLDVAHDRALGALAHGEHVADRERGLLARVDEGARVQALRRDEGLLAELVPVGVAEDDARQGCAAVGI